MAIIHCQECGGKFSDTSKACVHCGAPFFVAQRKTSGAGESLVLALVVLGIIAYFGSGSGKQHPDRRDLDKERREAAVARDEASRASSRPSVDDMARAPAPKPTPPPRMSKTPPATSERFIKASVVIGTTEAANARMNELAIAEDREGLTAMVLSGQVLHIEVSTQCRVLDPGMFNSKVIITSGEHRGKIAFLPNDYLR